jgi:hypothetical protein
VSAQELINEYSGLFGIWARPIKVSFDTELMSADNTFTRISPLQTKNTVCAPPTSLSTG